MTTSNIVLRLFGMTIDTLDTLFEPGPDALLVSASLSASMNRLTNGIAEKLSSTVTGVDRLSTFFVTGTDTGQLKSEIWAD